MSDAGKIELIGEGAKVGEIDFKKCQQVIDVTLQFVNRVGLAPAEYASVAMSIFASMVVPLASADFASTAAMLSEFGENLRRLSTSGSPQALIAALEDRNRAEEFRHGPAATAG